ncbi:MAG: hypothetical protein HY823_15830 [Acidobacteria bacterium]|nr:hypothetical protein [Acidobacteriota bacterium]
MGPVERTGPPAALLRFARLDSTQDFLKRHPELGFCGVLAERQEAGRGRWGNRWEGAGRGFCFSARIPDPGLPPGLLLQRAMSRVARALDPGGEVLGLKWPNDLVAHRAGTLVKVGGLLGESGAGLVTLGLGLNLEHAPTLPERAFPAASLADLGLPLPDPTVLALELLAAWGRLEDGAEGPNLRWPPQGEAVRWEGGQGVVLGWEEDGRLRLVSAAGILRLAAGEVQALAPRGT